MKNKLLIAALVITIAENSDATRSGVVQINVQQYIPKTEQYMSCLGNVLKKRDYISFKNTVDCYEKHIHKMPMIVKNGLKGAFLQQKVQPTLDSVINTFIIQKQQEKQRIQACGTMTFLAGLCSALWGCAQFNNGNFKFGSSLMMGGLSTAYFAARYTDEQSKILNQQQDIARKAQQGLNSILKIV